MLVLQVESNVKLEECLKKIQQENEDYKARMDKHAALSKYVWENNKNTILMEKHQDKISNAEPEKFIIQNYILIYKIIPTTESCLPICYIPFSFDNI